MDLIERQAAIEVASGYCHPANIAKELEKLPSAQPERPLRHCYSCEYWQTEKSVYNYCEKFDVMADEDCYCSWWAERREE